MGGTSLSAPAWAGLLALVDQGRADVGESTLNSTSPTDTQQALYMLPQSDYNMITSGNNGYSASAGYNLVTGLGTPVANLLVPDLIAYQGPGTSSSGSPVAPLQDAGLVNTGTGDGGPMDVFSVFDALTVSSSGLGDAQGQVFSTELSSPMNMMLAPTVTGRAVTSSLIAAGITVGPATNLSPAGIMPLAPVAVSITPVSTGFTLQQPAWSTARPVVDGRTGSEDSIALQRTDREEAQGAFLTKPSTALVLGSILDELTVEARLGRSLLSRRWPPRLAGRPAHRRREPPPQRNVCIDRVVNGRHATLKPGCQNLPAHANRCIGDEQWLIRPRGGVYYRVCASLDEPLS